MKSGDGERPCRRGRRHSDSGDQNHPNDASRQRRARHARKSGHEAADQVMGQREHGGKRAVRCVLPSVDAEFAEEDRVAVSRTDRERLGHREIARVDQVLDLKVHLEFVGNADAFPDEVSAYSA